MKKIFIIAISSALLFASCTKEIKLDLKTAEPALVIEGNVTNEAGPYTVSLHKTVNFSNTNSYPAVSGAVITISDNTGFTETLTEASAGIYKTSALVGTPGRTYNLKVTAEGKSYTATSTMPQVVTFDGIQFDLFTSKGNSGGPEYSTLPVFNDPGNVANSYRFIQTVNGKLDKQYYALNDNTFNGQKNDQVLFNPDMEIKIGDSVAVEFRVTDANAYLYFFTLSQFSTDGPYSTTPTNPPTNIKGDRVYGLFSAHTVQRRSAKVTGN